MPKTLRSVCLLSALALGAVAPGCGGDDGGPPAPTSRPYDALAYDLRGSFDWARGRLVASEQITLALAETGGPPAVELDAAVEVARVHAAGVDLPFALDPAARTLRVDLAALGPGGGERSFSVEYEAPTSVGLIAYQGRDDDPVRSRVVSTDSEPADGVNWLVARHVPSDRARWSVELTVEPDEDVVANGARVADEAAGGKRRVRYEMPQALPTYLMAFAAGQIERRERAGGRVPLAVWHRRGLAFEPERHLDLLAELMATFEARLGPYPFDSYAVVLLPLQPGGMENATVTFNVETSGQGAISFGLNAHELAHHWFGDWVTMRGFDDVWVKEGMATLLAAEALRPRSDAEGKGRLFGRHFDFDPDDAVVDRALAGQAKYTSGPYTRAAWLITQIRAAVGEEAFWGSLRAVLADHPLGDVDGETFVRAFAPTLDEASIQKVLATLEQKAPPQIGVVSADGAGGALRLSLNDPSGVLLAPLGVTLVDAAGQATAYALAPGGSIDVTVPAGGYLAPDEGDVHPNWSRSFAVDPDAYSGVLAPSLWPTAPAALAALGSRSAAHQEAALFTSGLPPAVGPAEFAAFYAQLDSPRARSYAEFVGCYALAAAAGEGDSVAEAAWVAALAPVLAAPAQLSFSPDLASCGTALAEQLAPELLGLAVAPDAANAGRTSYLLSFDYGPEASFSLASHVAAAAPSLLLRDRALLRLAYQAEGRFYTPVPAEQAPPWKALFREKLAAATSATRFNIVWRGVRGLVDDGALAAAGQKLRSINLSDDTRRQVACEAYTIAAARPAAWDEFRQAAEPGADLGPRTAEALADPAVCATMTAAVGALAAPGGPARGAGAGAGGAARGAYRGHAHLAGEGGF